MGEISASCCLSRTQSAFDNIAAQFHEETDGDSTMDLDAFKRATGCKSEFFAEKLFKAIDTDNSGDITLEEFIRGLCKLKSDNIDERIHFVFGIFDLDGDGYINGEELTTVLSASIEEDGGVLTESEASDLVASLMQLFDKHVNSKISYEEFGRAIRMYPDLFNGLTFGRFGTRSTKSLTVVHKKRFRRIRKAASWIQNNPQKIFTYGSVILILISCFLWRFLKYAGNCDDVDMYMKDPLTGYSRNDIVEMVELDEEMHYSPGDEKYMVFSKEMAEHDPIECQDARKRKLLSWSLPIAKGCGQAMKVTFTLILLPVSRNLMTTLRDTILKHFFLFDEAIEFHRFLGKVGFWLAWTHTICHAVDVINWRDPDRYRYWSWAFPQDRTLDDMNGVERDVDGSPLDDGEGRMMYNEDMQDGIPKMLFNEKAQPTFKDILTSCVAVTGIILIAIYTFAALFAFDYPKKLSIFKERPTDKDKRIRQWVLALGRYLNDFNNFWYSHHLFSIFYVALLFHPMPNLPDERNEWGWSDAWLWVGIPVVIYLTERMVRVKRSTSNTRVIGADLLDGDVVGLRFLRPRGFKYTPGQYVFVRCPQISRFEWHPFTLTSCPGDSYLGIHVRKAGDWTGALHELVKEHHRKKAVEMLEEGSFTSHRSKYCVKPVIGDEVEVVDRFDFSISVDGPFGAPAQNYADYKVLVLIGAGIGVTPFASVLTDLLDSLKQCACPKCGYSNPDYMRTRIRKVYFYWTVRSRSEASWFKHLLEAISLQDEDGLLDININITGIKKANDLRTMMLSLARYESSNGSSSDMPSRTVTRFGRIHWTEIFEKVRMEFPAEPTVGVFYCGPNTIGAILNKMCRQNSKGATKFLFMQESFG